ncbi:MAG TPA: 4-hydroxy-tetrahydrodipicolinate reductase, partial [Ruminococcus sp.]|nr:4-hydroxy-tetrahydrodipicolinate reductase [Ruminococcus sp.]
MIQIAISGVCGAMGKMLVSSIAERTDCEVCCGIDLRTDDTLKFPVYQSPAEMKEKPDVIIDYSHPS